MLEASQLYKSAVAHNHRSLFNMHARRPWSSWNSAQTPPRNSCGLKVLPVQGLCLMILIQDSGRAPHLFWRGNPNAWCAPVQVDWSAYVLLLVRFFMRCFGVNVSKIKKKNTKYLVGPLVLVTKTNDLQMIRKKMIWSLCLFPTTDLFLLKPVHQLHSHNPPTQLLSMLILHSAPLLKIWIRHAPFYAKMERKQTIFNPTPHHILFCFGTAVQMAKFTWWCCVMERDIRTHVGCSTTSI